MSIGRVMFSIAFSVGSRLKDWKMNPMRSRRRFVSSLSFMVVSSAPPPSRWYRKIRPLLTESRPARQCISVDLPDPDGPMIAVKRPRWIETSTASSAVTRVSPLP